MKITRREALAAGAAFVASPLAIARGDAQPKSKPEDFGDHSRYPHKKHGLEWKNEATANIFTDILDSIHQMPYLKHLRRIDIFDDSPQKLEAFSRWSGEGHLHITPYGNLTWTDVPSAGHAKPSAVVVLTYKTGTGWLTGPHVTVEDGQGLIGRHLTLDYETKKFLYRSTYMTACNVVMPALIYKKSDSDKWDVCWMTMEHMGKSLAYTVVPLPTLKARELYHCCPDGVEASFFHHLSVEKVRSWEKKS